MQTICVEVKMLSQVQESIKLFIVPPMKLSTLEVINTISTRSLNTIAWSMNQEIWMISHVAALYCLLLMVRTTVLSRPIQKALQLTEPENLYPKVIKTAGVTKIGMLFILSTPSTMAM